MCSHTSPPAVTSNPDRAAGGRFAVGNAGGPGNPFARQTAALRAYLIEHVTERDLQDILDILLLNAKGGHLPTIKLLFSYVLGKPKSVVEPDLLDLQEMQMLQQAAQAPGALETLCNQLPLDFQVGLTRHAQAENAATAVRTSHSQQADGATPQPTSPPSPPSTNGDNGEPRAPMVVDAPSTNGDFQAAAVADNANPPSTNGETPRRSPPHRPPGFAWLDELQRLFGGRAPT
jgi:hypothetical protein